MIQPSRLKWRTKFLIASIVLIFGLGGVVTAGASWIREGLFREWIIEFVEPLGIMLTTHIEHCMEVHTPEHFQDFVAHMRVTDKIAFVNVLKPDGRTIFSSSGAIGTMDSLFLHAPMRTVKAGVRVCAVGRAPKMYHVYTPISNGPRCARCHQADGPVIGYIAIAVNGAVASHGRLILTAYDFLRLIPILLLAVVGILFVHRYAFQRPFATIMAGVKSIEDGHLETRIDAHTPGEMGRLAESINHMAQKLKDAQAKLEQMHHNEMDRAGQLATVGELAAIVAHELKNPVAGIASALDVILDRHADLRERDVFALMRAEVTRMSKTLQSLLDFARPHDPACEPVDLHHVLRQVSRLYQEQFQRQGVVLSEEFAAGKPVVAGDGEQLKQVFVNIIINAFQACTPGNGRILLTSANSADGSQVTITVRDNGTGIPPADLEHIFKPFYTTKNGGTGLGLSLSRSIVEHHGGTIAVRSRPGEGTEFNLTFIVSDGWRGA